MLPLGPADNFTDALNNLQLDLSERDRFDAYYVPREESPIAEFGARLRMDKSPCKILYTGHGKSGKTTELFRLMFDLQDKFFIVYYSILKELEISDVEYIDLLLLTGLKLAENALENKPPLVDEDIKAELNNWLIQVSNEAILTKVEEKTKGKDLGGKLPFFIGEVGGSYKTSDTVRTEVRSKLKPRATDVIEKLDMVAEAIRQKAGKPPLVIIDDLEKSDLETGQNIFYKHSGSLNRPHCKIIFTVPISLIYSPEFRPIETEFAIREVLPCIRTMERDGKPYQPGLDLLRKIIERRMNLSLFEGGALEHLLKKANGVLSDLFSMATACCAKAEARKKNKITWDMVDEEFEKLTNTYRRMILDKYYLQLKKVWTKKATTNDEELRDLLHMLAVIEYERGYYDLHPAVVHLLKEKRLIK